MSGLWGWQKLTLKKKKNERDKSSECGEQLQIKSIKEVQASGFMSKHKKNVKGPFLDLPATWCRSVLERSKESCGTGQNVWQNVKLYSHKSIIC